MNEWICCVSSVSQLNNTQTHVCVLYLCACMYVIWMYVCLCNAHVCMCVCNAYNFKFHYPSLLCMTLTWHWDRNRLSLSLGCPCEHTLSFGHLCWCIYFHERVMAGSIVCTRSAIYTARTLLMLLLCWCMQYKRPLELAVLVPFLSSFITLNGLWKAQLFVGLFGSQMQWLSALVKMHWLSVWRCIDFQCEDALSVIVKMHWLSVWKCIESLCQCTKPVPSHIFSKHHARFTVVSFSICNNELRCLSFCFHLEMVGGNSVWLWSYAVRWETRELI